MATRLPYYSGQDDIYSQLMAQFAQQTPYYSVSPYYSATPTDTGLLGGYNANLFSQPAASSANATAASLGNRRVWAGEDLGGDQPTPVNPDFMFDPVTGQLVPIVAALANFGKSIGITGHGGLAGLLGIPGAIIANAVQGQNMLDIYGSMVEANQGKPSGLPSPGQAGFVAGLPGAYGQMTSNASSLINDEVNASLTGQTAANQALVDGMFGAGINFGPATVTDLSTLSQNAAAQQAAAEYNASLNAGAANAASDAAAAAANADAISSNADAVAGFEAAMAGDAGGGGGSKMICTKLHRLGKMPEDIFIADQAFGALMVKSEPETYAGYAIWARHVVRWMSREDWIGKTVVAIVHKIATPWSVAMAEEMGVDVKSGWFGRFLMKRGLQMCEFIGKMNQTRSLQNV